MGMVGNHPGGGKGAPGGRRRRLVNPLQGEGIAPAMTSGRAAADATCPPPAMPRSATAGSWPVDIWYHRVAAAGHAALVPHPIAVAAVGRALTFPPVGRVFAGGWGIFWNELLDGAVPGRARTIAATSARIGGALTGATATSRWLSTRLGAGAQPRSGAGAQPRSGAGAQPRSGAGPPK